MDCNLKTTCIITSACIRMVLWGLVGMYLLFVTSFIAGYTTTTAPFIVSASAFFACAIGLLNEILLAIIPCVRRCGLVIFWIMSSSFLVMLAVGLLIGLNHNDLNMYVLLIVLPTLTLIQAGTIWLVWSFRKSYLEEYTC